MVTDPRFASPAHNKTQEPRIIAGDALAGRAMVHTSLSGRDSEINSHQALKSPCRSDSVAILTPSVSEGTPVGPSRTWRQGRVGRADARGEEAGDVLPRGASVSEPDLH